MSLSDTRHSLGVLSHMFHHDASMAPLKARLVPLVGNMIHFSKGIIPTIAEVSYKLVVESEWRSRKFNMESVVNQKPDMSSHYPGAGERGSKGDDMKEEGECRQDDHAGPVKRRSSGSANGSVDINSRESSGGSRRPYHHSGEGPRPPLSSVRIRRHPPDYCPSSVKFCRQFVNRGLCLSRNCPFSHDQHLLRLRSQQLCPDLQRGRICQFRERCTYSHTQPQQTLERPSRRWGDGVGAYVLEIPTAVDAQQSREKEVHRISTERESMVGTHDSSESSNGIRAPSGSKAGALSGEEMQRPLDSSLNYDTSAMAGGAERYVHDGNIFYRDEHGDGNTMRIEGHVAEGVPFDGGECNDKSDRDDKSEGVDLPQSCKEPSQIKPDTNIVATPRKVRASSGDSDDSRSHRHKKSRSGTRETRHKGGRDDIPIDRWDSNSCNGRKSRADIRGTSREVVVDYRGSREGLKEARRKRVRKSESVQEPNDKNSTTKKRARKDLDDDNDGGTSRSQRKAFRKSDDRRSHRHKRRRSGARESRHKGGRDDFPIDRWDPSPSNGR